MIKEYEMAPFRRLLCAVIIQAVEDYQALLLKAGLEEAAASRVGRWLLSEQPDGHGNFPHLCELLERDPERLRSRLNTRNLLKEMRAYQKTLDGQFARYRAMVDGGLSQSAAG
jgi:hypothetical protein